MCQKQGINTQGYYVELPIIVFYKNGDEFKRYPSRDKKTGNSYTVKYYSKKEIINYFELDSIFFDLSNKQK